MEFNIEDIYDVSDETMEIIEKEVENLRQRMMYADAQWRLYDRIGILLGDSVLMDQLTEEKDNATELLAKDHALNFERITDDAELTQIK